jgi:hypothetical protein
MPIVIRAVGVWLDRKDVRRMGVILAIEEKQFHAGGATREDAEVYTIRIDRCAEW